MVHLPSGSWVAWKILICGGVITNTTKIVYRLHDQAEDEESI